MDLRKLSPEPAAQFSLGFSISEAVSFAPPAWLAVGRAASLRYRSGPTFREAKVGFEEVVLRAGSAGRALDVRVAREVRAELQNLKAQMLKDLDMAKSHAPNIRWDGRKNLALAGRQRTPCFRCRHVRSLPPPAARCWPCSIALPVQTACKRHAILRAVKKVCG